MEIIMKILRIIIIGGSVLLFFLVNTFTSCNPLIALQIDGERTKIFWSEAGKIEMEGCYDRHNETMSLTLDFMGEYLITPDSLLISPPSCHTTIVPVISVESHRFSIMREQKKPFSVNNGKVRILLKIKQQEDNNINPTSIQILPSSFIKCREKSIFTETITISPFIYYK